MAFTSSSRSGLPSNCILPSTSIYLAAEGLAGLLQFFEQALVYVALACLGGDQVPEMADLGLADAVDAAETLLEAVGVPGQVVVDHEVGALEVDALAGGVGGEEDAHLRVVAEGFFGGVALLPAQSAVDGDDGLFASQSTGDACMQIVEGIAVFGEDDQFLLGRGHGVRNFAGAVGGAGLGERADEQLVEQLSQLAPLGIASAAQDASCPGFQACEGADLLLQLIDGLGGGGLVEDLSLLGLDLVFGGRLPGLPSLRCRAPTWPAQRLARSRPCAAVPSNSWRRPCRRSRRRRRER